MTAVTVLEQIAEQLDRGSSVEQAAQRLGLSPREAMAAFKELARQAARQQRRTELAPVTATTQPEASPEIADSMPMPKTGAEQRLWCEAGQHHWTRPARRGRKPSSCPQHG